MQNSVCGVRQPCWRPLLLLLCTLATLQGCAVTTVAGAAVSLGVTAISIGATVVETTVDVAAAGVKAAVGSAEDD